MAYRDKRGRENTSRIALPEENAELAGIRAIDVVIERETTRSV